MVKMILSFISLLIITSCSVASRENIEEVNEYEWFSEIAKIAAMENEEFDREFKDVSLVPYIGEGYWLGIPWWGKSGYINSKNFEIMIPARYHNPTPFLYGYAVVIYQDTPDIYNFSVINKKGTEILVGFNNITLLDTENGDFVFALTAKYLRDGKQLLSINYQLYNLNTGNILIEEDERFTTVGRSEFSIRPKISFFSNYMTYDDDIYEIKDNGTIEKTETDINSLVSKIIEERNLTFKENNFHYHGDSYNFDPYFEYFDMLDFNVLLKNIPDNMRIIDVKKNDNQLKDERPVYFIQPINKDKIHPLKKNKLLYEVRLANRRNNETYIGLYDAEENEWAIPPITLDNNRGDPEEIGFAVIRRTGYEDWIMYTYFVYASSDEYSDNSRSSYYTTTVYNIREKKIYPFEGDRYGTMFYRGPKIDSTGLWTTKDY